MLQGYNIFSVRAQVADPIVHGATMLIVLGRSGRMMFKAYLRVTPRLLVMDDMY